MIINCVWEHNGSDTLLYATNFVGAYTRGESLEIAKAKMPQEIVSYCSWLGMEAEGKAEIVIVGEKCSELTIRDADSDVLFESEQAQLTIEEYETLKTLALKSAKDFLALYESIPDKDAAAQNALRPLLYLKWSLCIQYFLYQSLPTDRTALPAYALRSRSVHLP